MTAIKFLYSLGGNNTNKAINLDIHNTSKLDFSFASYIITGGFTAIYNDYKVNDNTLVSGTNTKYDNVALPKGTQEIYSFYIDQDYTQSIFNINANVNFTTYRLLGQKPAYEYREGQNRNTPNYLIENNKQNFYINASIMASVKVHDYFTPFISYTRANRVPAPQEAFYINGYNFVFPNGNQIPRYFTNPNLRHERGDTYQVGFNSFKQGVFTKDDVFGLKALYYYTNIKDFIMVQNIFVGLNTHLLSYQNGHGVFHGFELEANYDLGYFYARLGYTHQENDYGGMEFSGGSLGQQTPARISQAFTKPPKDVATLDIGGRFLKEKVIFGSIIKFSGNAERLKYESKGYGSLITTTETLKVPVLVDLYVRYEPIRNVNLKLEIQNLFNFKYIDPLSNYTNTVAQSSSSSIRSSLDVRTRGLIIMGSFIFRY